MKNNTTLDRHILLTNNNPIRVTFSLVAFLLLTGMFSAPLFAQSSQDLNRVEVYGGYALGRVTSSTTSLSYVDPSGAKSTISNLCSSQTGQMIGTNSQQFFCARRNFNGFDTSVTYNVTKYIGIKGNITGSFRTEKFVDVFNPPGVTQTITTTESLYNFLGGIQVKNNSRMGRVKPFAHVLVGAAKYTGKQQQTLDLFPQGNYTAEDRTTTFAMKVGGGLDLKVTRHVDIRLIEFDYAPMFAGNRAYKNISGPFTFSSTGKTANNLVFSFGIVIH